MARSSGEEKPKTMVTSTGYWYSDASSSNPNIPPHLMSQLNNFESNPEIYNLTTGMEMMGYKNLHHQQHQPDTTSVLWKGFFSKPTTVSAAAAAANHHQDGGPAGPSSSKAMNDSSSTGEFYQHDFSKPPDFTTGISDTTNETLMVSPDSTAAAWHHENRLIVDDPSMRCVFPCEGNERPSQGLSLSLSSSNPSSIGLQSFELRQQDGFFGKAINIQQQQQMMQDGFLGKAAALNHHAHFQIRSSKYLGPAQELLNEFCSLGPKQNNDHTAKIKVQKSNQWQDEDGSSSSKKQSLYSLDLLELQKRKAKLLQMLEEVDRRYKHYCDQMKAVVSSFEAVAGNGAARVYSALASKAMSRHFRCLRDGIVGQIKATKKAMGEKDTAAPGTTRGETPRLRILDQTLRQQRAFQQMSMMESHPWRPQRGLPERSVSVLRAWLFEHFLHPYPSDVDKHILARQTGLSRSQVSNWFINARVRLWKPMVEEMYVEETKEQLENLGSPDGAKSPDDNTPHSLRPEDQKPTPDQLVRVDSECISSIINNPDKNDHTGKSCKTTLHQDDHSLHFSRAAAADSFGAMELDFSSFNHTSVHYANESSGRHAYGGNGGGGVSLTLGLQQHGGSSGQVSLAFSPSAAQSSLFYPRDHIEDCPQVQYSMLDSEGQNLQYRNLMGAQLLHDLAG